jgi:uncharacterized phage infection (PIP) family protein YhgE
MRTTRTLSTGIGLALGAFIALAGAGCQQGSAPTDHDQPATPLAETAGNGAPPTTPAPEALKQEAVKIEQTIHAGVQQTSRQVEQSIEQALPPPSTPAPDPSAAFDQGVQKVTAEVQQKTDELNQDIHQIADELKQKAHESYDQTRKKLQREIAPNTP